jgi:hypothetical protein
MTVLKDPTFWTAVIALLALVLSQLPPVHVLLKRRELLVILQEHLFLYHYLGNTQLLAFLELHNTGGRDITIAKIDCAITDGDGHHWSLPAQTYLSRQPSPAAGQPAPELFIGRISLKPGGHWAETVHFFKVWSVQDEEDVSKLTARMKADINAKLAERKPEESKKPAEADDRLVKEATDLFEKKFNMAKGNYRLIIAALSESKEALAVRGFDFTLFDHHIRALRSATEDYKFGAGVYYQNLDPSRQAVLRLRPVPDAEARKQYTVLTSHPG